MEKRVKTKFLVEDTIGTWQFTGGWAGSWTHKISAVKGDILEFESNPFDNPEEIGIKVFLPHIGEEEFFFYVDLGKLLVRGALIQIFDYEQRN